MPWCEECGQFQESERLAEGGKCPRCGRVLVAPAKKASLRFKLIVVLTAVYLTFRLVQGILWLAHHA